MVKRLLSLVAALAIVGAPVALDACQIACASMSSDPMMAHDVHQAHHHHTTAADGSCHEAQAAPQHLLSPATCDHDEEGTALGVAAARTSDGVILIAAAVPSVAEIVIVRVSTVVEQCGSALPNRLEIRLASPLRI